PIRMRSNPSKWARSPLRALVLIPINPGSLIPPSGFIDVTDMQPPKKAKRIPGKVNAVIFKAG
ncbi:hypothetical protein QUH32_27470, partial [Klebsiella pneumoniae]|uniref:hypothetical protein n=1 Tax=Klebsiella pneumoniae TaxID=573 RepID=UPI0025A12F09